MPAGVDSFDISNSHPTICQLSEECFRTEESLVAACGFAFQNVKEIHKCEIGGADGVRTHDLLDAIEARSQLRHGPTELTFGILP